MIIVGRADHPSSIVRPEFCEQQFREKKWRRRATSTIRAASSRCTTQAARAGRAGRSGIAPPSPCARAVEGAIMVNRGQIPQIVSEPILASEAKRMSVLRIAIVDRSSP